jgi:hypothetical protein
MTQPGFATTLHLPVNSLFSFLQISCSKDVFLDNQELKPKLFALTAMGLVPTEFIGRKIGAPDETFHQTWRLPGNMNVQDPAIAFALTELQELCADIHSQGCYSASCLLFLQQDFQPLWMRVHLQQYPLLFPQLQHYQHLFLDNNTILIKFPPLEWEKLHQRWLSQEIPHPLSQLQGASSISWTLGTFAAKLRINDQPGGLTFLPLQLRPIKLHVALETFLHQDPWFLRTFGAYPVLRQAARTGQGIMSVLSLQLPLSRATGNDHWLTHLGALFKHPGGASFVLE